MEKHFFRRHLPHLHFNEGIYFITARLYDPILFRSLKEKKVTNISKLTTDEFQNHFKDYDESMHRGKATIFYLKDPEIARILQNEIHSLDGKEYELIAYTIMPNHFHIVFNLLKNNSGISKITKQIKGRSSYLINKILNRRGKLWQDESYDRWVRDDRELYFVIKYILENPVKAGFVKNWYEWQFTYCKEEYIVL